MRFHRFLHAILGRVEIHFLRSSRALEMLQTRCFAVSLILLSGPSVLGHEARGPAFAMLLLLLLLLLLLQLLLLCQYPYEAR